MQLPLLSHSPVDAMALGERILELLDEGAFSSSYKYALLFALVELCIEAGELPRNASLQLSSRTVAEKVIELYWPHTLPFETYTLRQNNRGQAEILKAISEFQSYRISDRTKSPCQFRQENEGAWAKLVSEIEWKLIEMPLPRLQTVGNRNEPFLYNIGWHEQISRRAVREYQGGRSSEFDGTINLLPGVAEGLVRLSPLLKPMIRRKWTLLVAKFNRLEVSRLEDFLFGENRIALAGARLFLSEMQKGRCFYCGDTLRSGADVDHFIPWSRYANNAIENLVLAHSSCNNNKRDFLASSKHVLNWMERLQPGSRTLSDLGSFAQDKQWDHWPDRSCAVASAVYGKLPEGYNLWQGINNFVPYQRNVFIPLLSSPRR